MTHADTTEAFLAKIIADPADDGPRIVYADWCEEHGQGERSELIRVQCELAIMPDLPQTCEVYHLKNGSCKRCKPYKLLRRRAHELLTQHEPDWAGEFMPDARWTYAVSDRSFTFQNGGQAIFNWHRGFISQVECRLETWRGRTCERCGKETPTQRQEHDAWQGKCGMCNGVGRIGGIGPQLVRRAPVEAVVVTDRKPADRNSLNGMWYWFRDVTGENGTDGHLPQDVFDSLPNRSYETIGMLYPSAAAANAALSAALLAESSAALEPSGPRVVQCGT